MFIIISVLLCVALLVITLSVFEIAVSKFVLAVVNKLILRGKRKRALFVVRLPLFIPSLRSKYLRTPLRSLYAHLLFQHKRYKEALIHYDSIARLPIAVDAVMHAYVRRGDCLAALGRNEDALLAWQVSLGRMERVADGYNKFDALADLAGRRKDVEAEYLYLQKTLPYCVGAKAQLRPHLILRLSVTATLLHRPEESRRWAERNIAEQTSVQYLHASYGQAGVASIALGDLAAAERCYRMVSSLAEKIGDPIYTRLAEGKTAHVDELSGRLVPAIDRLEKLDSQPREAHLLFQLGRCLRHLGRHEKALGAYQRILDRPADRPWTQDSLDTAKNAYIGCARQCVELDRQDDALHFLMLGDALPSSSVHRNAHLSSKAAILAKLGKEAEAAEVVSLVTAEMDQIIGDAQSAKTIFTSLATAQFHLKDYVGQYVLLARRKSLGFFPIDEPLFYYSLGQCEQALGNARAAREAFEFAAGVGFETCYVEKAREALAAL